MVFDPNDYKVSGPQNGAGGQRVSMSSTTVLVEHVPTGLKAEVTARSQHKSREIALDMIAWALLNNKHHL